MARSLEYALESEGFNVLWAATGRRALELALSNLLENALKFTPAGGQVELGAEQRQDLIRLWVKDNGPGIDPMDQLHLFERFYRGQPATQVEGSGLGLTIAYSIVQAHAGRILVESELGAGSCFVIELSPVSPPDSHDHSQADQPGQAGQGRDTPQHS